MGKSSLDWMDLGEWMDQAELVKVQIESLASDAGDNEQLLSSGSDEGEDYPYVEPEVPTSNNGPMVQPEFQTPLSQLFNPYTPQTQTTTTTTTTPDPSSTTLPKFDITGASPRHQRASSHGYPEDLTLAEQFQLMKLQDKDTLNSPPDRPSKGGRQRTLIQRPLHPSDNRIAQVYKILDEISQLFHNGNYDRNKICGYHGPPFENLLEILRTFQADIRNSFNRPICNDVWTCKLIIGLS